MTTKDDFTDEEWARVVRAPFVAGLAITLADPGGPFEAAKETMATLKSATNPPSREQLLADVALEVQAMSQEHQHPLKGYRPAKGEAPGRQVLDELRDVQAVVAAKATPEEASAFAGWLVASAKAAAEAAKDGGFMGFGAQQVSEREQDMLDQVAAAVSG
ncbi:hypothetical protein EKO23_19125 [Nocardioides guangzhouensis]|uniref:Uncharacterized protein n=1 Tax=Nocardioides guangzhouensis TaxID=2497878 RepID=A0A4Q4Z8A0_9ACTN|nr:hypothetical protein [Nocardioides guangzhouensis]RYP83411.1 hypothetical protein EKO23_19125 [Nocardioides guangzhouensis]